MTTADCLSRFTDSDWGSKLLHPCCGSQKLGVVEMLSLAYEHDNSKPLQSNAKAGAHCSRRNFKSLIKGFYGNSGYISNDFAWFKYGVLTFRQHIRPYQVDMRRIPSRTAKLSTLREKMKQAAWTPEEVKSVERVIETIIIVDDKALRNGGREGRVDQQVRSGRLRAA
ncbi:hypothetical protein FGB62_9g32 [Gracilaria domingensis]|nr:hypothetical protein FGB62_9g32 [Gracilaria domingensis]